MRRTTRARHAGSRGARAIAAGAESHGRAGAGAGMSTKGVLRDCLYFTANALARSITRMAEEEFRPTGLSPSYAFLLMLVAEQPGTGQKELGEALQLAPSTVTRFVDALAHRDLVTRKSSGRTAAVSPTTKGRQLLPAIHQAWSRLRQRYTARLGKAAGQTLTRQMDRAQVELEK